MQYCKIYAFYGIQFVMLQKRNNLVKYLCFYLHNWWLWYGTFTSPCEDWWHWKSPVV